MCAWNNHYCWPGTCGADGLTQDCTCAPGFRKVTLYGANINEGETTCQLLKKPSIDTCDTVAFGPNGEKNRANGVEDSSACDNLQDMYGNFQPSEMQFDMASDYHIDVSNITKPKFIIESNFGISDSTIRLKHMAAGGMILKT